jgi:hypothetical protein
VPPPNLPPKPPSPWLDDPQQGSQQRRGAETLPAASNQNSYPFHQGPDDEVNDPRGPTRDPRRSAPPPRPFSILPLPATTPIHSPNPGLDLDGTSQPNSPQPTISHTASKQLPPSTSASSTPIPSLPQLSRGIYQSRIPQLEIDAFKSTNTNNYEPPVAATPTPRSHPSLPIRSMSTPHLGSASTSTQPLTGMHPDRFALLSSHNRPSSAATSTQLLPRTSLDGSQLSPTFLSGTISPRDGPIPSSSRIRLDDVAGSTTHGFPPLVSFTSSSNSRNQYASIQTHVNPNQSKKAKNAQKRKAFEALPPPKPPKPAKMQRTGKWKPGQGNNGGGPGAAQLPVLGKKPNNRRGKKKKGKITLNSQPGPSNLHREEGERDGANDGNDGYGYEERDVHGG